IDTRSAMRRLVKGLQPRWVIILETELWPNFLAELKRQHVPSVLVNARLSERSARGYRKYRWLIGEPWLRLAYIAAQDSMTAERILNLRVEPNKIEIMGNLKYDFRAPQSLIAAGETFKREWQRPVWVAASTHAGEDEQIIAAQQHVLEHFPDALLILVPRHPERFEQVSKLIKASGLHYCRRSSQSVVTSQQQVMLGDTMGELVLWYATSDAAFIGGSLIDRGGHNPLESIATNTPIISGPHVFNFDDVYSRLDTANAVVWADSAIAVADAICQLLTDRNIAMQQAQRAAAEFAPELGVTERLVNSIRNRLPSTDPTTRTLSMMQSNQPKVGQTIWYDDNYFKDMHADMFTPDYWRSRKAIRGAATGRSTAFFIETDLHQLLLRHYYRGGLVGKVNKDRFKREPVEQSRAMAEFSLLLKLRELGLPVPNPVAAHFQQASIWGYRADILVEVIPESEDLFKRLQQAPVSADRWQAIGGTIKQFHAADVYHSDLNCHNILVDKEQTIWLVDFDKCGFKEKGDWQQANLQRLLRSLLKEQKKAAEQTTAFYFDEERDWPQLLAGYQS
ncbi:MAG TPA: 3-deoxy-D-manno-octulosonic acid kinase, partial [Pseudidiomarina sp.]|nr:3-deoxy-D-manno-octulosonic acid kinase [Pseudidiomarina sp.]